MLKKLILLLVILATLYSVAVFKFPEVADTIWSTIGLSEFNDKIRSWKDTYDNVVTDIPSKTDLLDTYSWAINDARNIRDDLKDKVDMTKDRIDDIRTTLSGAEDTYNEVKDTIWEAKEFIDETTDKIDEVKWTLEKVSDVTKKIDEVTEVFSTWSTSN